MRLNRVGKTYALSVSVARQYHQFEISPKINYFYNHMHLLLKHVHIQVKM